MQGEKRGIENERKRRAEDFFGVLRGVDLYTELMRGRKEDEKEDGI